jgi:PadR family transcriptional regulator AphA
MKHKSLTEYVILGAFVSGAAHGYEIMQFLGSALEATCRLSTSQLYVLLKRLEQEGLLESSLETQESRPSKRVFNLTGKGRKAFLEWLHTPVEHVRDFRMEFLCKIYFFDSLSLTGGHEFVEAQIRALKKLLNNIQRRLGNDESRFMKLVYGFKARNVECLISWLAQEARPFVEGESARKKEVFIES